MVVLSNQPPSKNYLIVSGYTPGRYAELASKGLFRSLVEHQIMTSMVEYEDRGSWGANCKMKPILLLEALLVAPPQWAVVWLDADSVVMQEPTLFEPGKGRQWIGLVKAPHENNQYLPGTIWLTNSIESKLFLTKWIAEQTKRKYSHLSDMEAFREVIKTVSKADIFDLPGSYCKIFDTMHYIENPVIETYQASRYEDKNRRD